MRAKTKGMYSKVSCVSIYRSSLIYSSLLLPLPRRSPDPSSHDLLTKPKQLLHHLANRFALQRLHRLRRASKCCVQHLRGELDFVPVGGGTVQADFDEGGAEVLLAKEGQRAVADLRARRK
jgi:hypothetical protein